MIDSQKKINFVKKDQSNDGTRRRISSRERYFTRTARHLLVSGLHFPMRRNVLVPLRERCEKSHLLAREEKRCQHVYKIIAKEKKCKTNGT